MSLRTMLCARNMTPRDKRSSSTPQSAKVTFVEGLGCMIVLLDRWIDLQCGSDRADRSFVLSQTAFAATQEDLNPPQHLQHVVAHRLEREALEAGRVLEAGDAERRH